MIESRKMVLDEGMGRVSSDVDSDSVIKLVACALPSSAFRASSTTRNPRYRNFVNVRALTKPV